MQRMQLSQEGSVELCAQNANVFTIKKNLEIRQETFITASKRFNNYLVHFRRGTKLCYMWRRHVHPENVI